MTDAIKAQYQTRLAELGKMSREDRHSALQLTDEYELICLARANGIHVPRVRWQLVSRIENASMQAAAQQVMKRLTAEQLDGRACVVCGSNHRPMIPIGLETRTSTEVFSCQDTCPVDILDVQAWIIATERHLPVPVKPCPVEIIATGLQNLALSSVLGRNPAHHDVTPARPDLATMLGKASSDSRPFTRQPSTLELA